jgi:hypothetical protein
MLSSFFQYQHIKAYKKWEGVAEKLPVGNNLA